MPLSLLINNSGAFVNIKLPRFGTYPLSDMIRGWQVRKTNAYLWTKIHNSETADTYAIPNF